MAVPDHTQLVETLCLVCPFSRGEDDAGEADDLPATLHGDVVELLLEFVPSLALDGRVEGDECSHACVVQLDLRRFGWRRDGWYARLAKNAARLLGERRSPLPLIQADRPL